MFIGSYTEWPWQDATLDLRGKGGTTDLALSNREYNPQIGNLLYNRYLDEKLYAEEVGFDMLMLNEHHSAPFCMQGVTNVGASILARQSKKAKIVILGNVLPLWDDPLWLAEQLAMVDMISHGRLVTGWVRGGGRESFSHNAPPHYNWERFKEAHDFIVTAWTKPGPFRWEGKHHQYRYVNPWSMPLQKPYPMIWIPGVASVETVRWTARHHYPYIMLATQLEATKEMFDIYHETAAEDGYKSGPQSLGYLFKVHLEDSDDRAYEVGKKYIEGVNNPFNTGNEGEVKAWVQQPPGISTRDAVKRRMGRFSAGPAGRSGGAGPASARSYEAQQENLQIITGTPKSVQVKVRKVLETLRPGQIFLWDGEGLMDHGDCIRSMTLMGQELIPWIREQGKELGLLSAYEVNDGTGHPNPPKLGI
ncbi:MAG: LLM class flavin-dependent oxidoreductase [Dehalococcoidia bacterium]|nr:LLM class flavin-dependent oxidoreductase [Dehalococcoidia bacterium]